MGSMKQKRRKKLKRAWAEFQATHGLSDRELGLLRETGLRIEALQQKLMDSAFDPAMSTAKRIDVIHRQWAEQLALRKAAIEAGLIERPKQKKKKPTETHDPQWVKAKQLCRLNMEDIRKAKELGLNPRSLIKNIPSPSQQWKAPVKLWIQGLYEERMQRRSKKHQRDDLPGDHESIVDDWKRHAE